MEIRKLSPKISKLLGHYDLNLQRRADQGCVGYAEYLCYQRFVDDLDREENDPGFEYYFDTKEVKRVMDFSGLLTYYDEKGTRHPLELYPFQKFIVANIYGWKNKESGLLRYRETYATVARRNGKSFLTAVLMHYFMTGSSYRSERGIIFSAKLDLAMIAFRQFCSFIDADQDLADLYKYSKINGNANSLGTDNYLEVFSGAKNQDGFSSGYAIGDEIALQDGELYNLIIDGQANLSQSMLIGISTAGFNIGGWAHERYKGYRRMLDMGTLPDNFFLYAAEPDAEDDLSDWTTWAKANPALFFNSDGTVRQDKVDLYATKYQNAVRQGGKTLNSFITKQINRWNAAADTLMCDFDLLQKSRYKFTFKDVMATYKDWYLGVDLSQVLDLNSVCWATWIYVSESGKLLPLEKREKGHQKLYINVTNYIPSATLARHIQSDRFAYDKYIGRELWLTKGGNGQRTDYTEILKHIEEIKDVNQLHLVTIACDPYGCSTIQSGLEAICDCLIMQNQSHKALSPYVEQFNGLVAAEEIALSGDSSDIFMKAITNSVVCTDDQGYVYISKPTVTVSTNYRIDPADAMIDCIIAPLIDRDNEKYSYEDAISDWSSIYNS